MDDLLKEFLIETNESLDVVDVELVRFEQEPNNAEILGNVFRLVHTIKGTCGFLGLPRLEALAHAAETLMSKFRDGMPVTGEAVTLVLSSIDRIKEILAGLEADQREPEGADTDLIGQLEDMVRQAERGRRGGAVLGMDRRHPGAADPAAPASPRRGFARRTGAGVPRDAGSGDPAAGSARGRADQGQARRTSPKTSPTRRPKTKPTTRSQANRSASASIRSKT